MSIHVYDYVTPAGNRGWRVVDPEVPGCAVVHGSRDRAVELVEEARAAWIDDTRRPREWWTMRFFGY